jgi:hypothetical protein
VDLERNSIKEDAPMNRKPTTVILSLVLCGFLGLLTLAGCATTNSTPATQATSKEQGQSWSDVRANMTAVNLGDVARLASVVPGDGDQGNGNGGVTTGKQVNPAVKAAIASGRPVVVLESLTVNQTITTNAAATRSGTQEQTPSNGSTSQTPTNSPTTSTDVKLPAIP